MKITYSSVVRAGDIVFFKSDGTLLSRLICWGSQSEYAHVAVVSYVSPTVEALPKLTLIRNITGGNPPIFEEIGVYRERGRLVVRLKPEFRKTLVAQTRAVTYLNKYPVWKLPYVGLRSWLVSRYRITLPEWPTAGAKMCSEDIALLCGLKENTISPGLLFELLRAKNMIEDV